MRHADRAGCDQTTMTDRHDLIAARFRRRFMARRRHHRTRGGNARRAEHPNRSVQHVAGSRRPWVALSSRPAGGYLALRDDRGDDQVEMVYISLSGGWD